MDNEAVSLVVSCPVHAYSYMLIHRFMQVMSSNMMADTSMSRIMSPDPGNVSMSIDTIPMSSGSVRCSQYIHMIHLRPSINGIVCNENCLSDVTYYAAPYCYWKGESMINYRIYHNHPLWNHEDMQSTYEMRRVESVSSLCSDYVTCECDPATPIIPVRQKTCVSNRIYPKLKSFWSCSHMNCWQHYMLHINLHILCFSIKLNLNLKDFQESNIYFKSYQVNKIDLNYIST